MNSLARIASFVLALGLLLGLIGFGITRETPVGGLIGVIRMKENGRPLSFAMVHLRPVQEVKGENYLPTDDQRDYLQVECAENGAFTLRDIAAGAYEMTVSARAHTVRSQVVAIKEGRPKRLEVEAEPFEPFVNLYASQHVFVPDEAIEFSIHGFGEGSEFEVEVYRLAEDRLLRYESLYSALAPLAAARNSAIYERPDQAGTRLERIAKPIQSRDFEGVFNERIALPKLPEGLYWVQAGFRGQSQGTWMSVSRVALVTKEAEGRLDVFATDLRTGAPLPGVQLGFREGAGFGRAGTTDARGLATLRPGPRTGILMGSLGASRAFVNLRVEPPATGQTVSYVYTDRPVYRPGDEVSYKGVVRRLEGDVYTVPAGQNVSIEVRDPDDNLVQRTQVPLSAMGSFFGKVATNREANPGYYTIRTTIGTRTDTSTFEVADYRKPEYAITVRPAKETFVRGETAEAVIECEYFFGGPVQNADVTVTVYRMPAWDFGPAIGMEEEFEEYEDSYYGGEYVESLEAETDSSGRAIVRFDTAVDPAQNREFESNDAVYTLQASVSAGDYKYFDGEGKVRVVRGEIGTHVEISQYVVEPDRPFDATIRAYDPQSRKPLPGQELVVAAGYEVWAGKNLEFRPFAEQTVRTNAKGLAVMAVTPRRGGTVTVRATAIDRRGNRVASAGTVWVDRAGDLYGDAPPIEEDIVVRLDRRDYEPGDRAKVVLDSPDAGATVWLTVEGDRIYLSQIVRLDRRNQVVELPIQPDFAPTAFVNVTYVKNKRLVQQQRRLAVDLGVKRLTVEVRADRETYEPGDRATYSIRTTADGKPIPAEVSLGIVDEAIYAIQEDDTDILAAFYPKRYNSVETRYSFEEIYLDGGDKAPASIEIRKRFQDTAFWNPVVATDANGRATVTLELPDNLTTWRATAVGITADTRVGQAVSKVIARKPLMVRLQAPMFLVRGDRATLVAQVTNDTGREAEVKLELAGQSAGLQGELRRSQKVADGATASFEWQVLADRTGTAVFTAKAWIDERIHDGVELRVPCQPKGRLFVESVAEVVEGSKSFEFSVRDGADLDYGRLKLTIAPHLAGSLVAAADDLIDYPYGCVEQTMSRFLPTVLVARAVQQAGFPAPSRASEIPSMAAEGIARLQKMQHEDGGWGWWEFDPSDEFMTGYVLEGLRYAREAGFAPHPESVQNAVDWGKARLKTPFEDYLKTEIAKITVDDAQRSSRTYRDRELRRGRIQLLCGLAMAGAEIPAEAWTGVEPAAGDSYATASLVLAHAARHDAYSRDRWMARLMEQSARNGGLASWPEQYGVENTARALHAITAVNPSDPAVPSVVRYLLLKRRGDAWFSTRDTAAILVGLTPYLARTKEMAAAGPITVRVNGKEVARYDASKRSLRDEDWQLAVPIRSLVRGTNRVEILRPGGSCYLSAELRQVVSQNEMDPIEAVGGFSVQREYFRLGENQLENGRIAVLPSDRPIEGAASGDRILVRLTLETKTYRQYLIVEDPIPSNCRIQDRGEVDFQSDWTWWWSQHVVRDDRIAFFMTDLPPGKHELTYVMRAESPGLAYAMPTAAYNMYDPDARASTGLGRMEVAKK